ncbi:hypothetical protein FA13DRAFT_55262 [Coprinellus micaceus]|uniref:Uncharacterized protein n=1 Tax=Coprinellus micaceus TaxID=71717 RepID=A0A4Y7U109_COPMI|nr:hypothetical protein FA13DRAFT_55262 [Coprinellus micaceus]
MKSIVTLSPLLSLVQLAIPAAGHIGAYGPGMYCRGGADPNVDNQNANDVSQPLFNVTKRVWWMHAENGCDKLPPPAGEFLELPSGGQVTLELATNRAFTTTSTQPLRLGVFGNGEDFIFPEHVSEEGCVWEPNLHTKSEAEAAGTVLAISYASRVQDTSDINLSVISVAYNTPWRRLANYSIPLLPPCGVDGCICAWGWVPLGCGRPDMYMQPFRCKVVGENAIVTTYKVRPKSAKPPVWCQDDSTKCVKGAKQMIYYNQLDGNNIDLTGKNNEGNPRKPAYDMRYGYANGAQWDVIDETLIPDMLKNLLPGHQ